GSAISLGLRRTLHRPDRHPADELPRRLADAGRRAAPAREPALDRAGRRRGRLRIGSGLHARLRPRDRPVAGALATRGARAERRTDPGSMTPASPPTAR